MLRVRTFSCLPRLFESITVCFMILCCLARANGILRAPSSRPGLITAKRHHVVARHWIAGRGRLAHAVAGRRGPSKAGVSTHLSHDKKRAVLKTSHAHARWIRHGTTD